MMLSKGTMIGIGRRFVYILRELFPLIESRYRALPEGRAIAGVSLGGLFGVFSLLTRPTLFQRYILVSPAFVWDNKRLWQYEADYRTKSKVLPATVFTAVGTEDTTATLRPWTEFGRLIEDRHYERLRWIMHSYADESHISVLPGALSRGIKRVFEK